MTSKSAFPGFKLEPEQGGITEVAVPGMTLAEWQWTRFAERTLQEYLRAALSAIPAGASLEHATQLVKAAPGSAVEAADRMMSAIAEREQGERDE